MLKQIKAVFWKKIKTVPENTKEICEQIEVTFYKLTSL